MERLRFDAHDEAGSFFRICVAHPRAQGERLARDPQLIQAQDYAPLVAKGKVFIPFVSSMFEGHDASILSRPRAGECFCFKRMAVLQGPLSERMEHASPQALIVQGRRSFNPDQHARNISRTGSTSQLPLNCDAFAAWKTDAGAFRLYNEHWNDSAQGRWTKEIYAAGKGIGALYASTTNLEGGRIVSYETRIAVIEFWQFEHSNGSRLMGVRTWCMRSTSLKPNQPFEPAHHRQSVAWRELESRGGIEYMEKARDGFVEYCSTIPYGIDVAA